MRGTSAELRIKFDLVHFLSLVFIIWVLISNPEAAWSGPDRNWIFTFVQLFILMIMAGGLIDEPKKHQVLMGLFAAVSVISAFTAISQGYIGEDISASARVGGFAAGANDAARYFVVAMVFLTYLRSKSQDALLRLMSGRTAFVIAHRLSTIREADQLLVINDGRVIERGNHESLISERGFYYNLYMSQFRHQSIEQDYN